MTMTPITCDDFSERLAGYLERDASPGASAAVESHAAGCGPCAALLQELSAITSEAATLPQLEPERDLWSGIAARIDAPVIPIAVASGRRGAAEGTRIRTRRWWAHPALAAAALVGVTASATYYMTKESIEGPVAAPRIAQAPTVDGSGTTDDAASPAQLADAGGRPESPGQGPDSQRAARGAGAGESQIAAGRPVNPGAGRVGGQMLAMNGQRATGVAAATAIAPVGDLQLASYRPGETAALDSLYYREIIRLRQLLNERSAQLDSSTVTVINRNMLVIDRAIQECRAALAADPASKFLNQQLNQALETKIELLRTAAMMPAGAQGE